MNRNLRKALHRFGLTVKNWELLKFLEGPGINRAVIFKCWECRGYPEDFGAAVSCTNTDCPLWRSRCVDV